MPPVAERSRSDNPDANYLRHIILRSCPVATTSCKVSPTYCYAATAAITPAARKTCGVGFGSIKAGMALSILHFGCR